jgi:hypothetical protein
MGIANAAMVAEKKRPALNLRLAASISFSIPVRA